MTICIAALAEEGKKLLLKSDQMITISVPMEYEFETDNINKICALTDNVCVLTAGNSLLAAEIIANSKKELSAIKAKETDNKGSLSVEDIVEIVRTCYVSKRLIYVEQSMLAPRGLNLNSYYANQKSLNAGVIATIENEFMNFNLGVELIIAGYSNNENCRIFNIRNPGISLCHDEMGFFCTGIGAPHATYHFIDSNYNKNLDENKVDAIMCEAKKRSEKAPGVGEKTNEHRITKLKNL